MSERMIERDERGREIVYVSEKDIPLFQQSIDAIEDPSQRATLKEIRDRKINQEQNAMT